MRWVTPSQSSLKAFGPPTVRIENGTSESVSQCASADAIFIGCCSNMILAWKSPETTSTSAEMNIATTPKRTVGRYRSRAARCCSCPSSVSRPRARARL